MQTNDLPRIGVLSADPAAVTQFLRRVQALGADPTALLPLSPAAVPDCEPYLCGTSTQSPLPKLRAAAEVLAASGCTVIATPDSAGVFCEEITAAVGIPTLGVSGPALQQLVGKLRQRASVLCTPGVRAANGYAIAARASQNAVTVSGCVTGSAASTCTAVSPASESCATACAICASVRSTPARVPSPTACTMD